MPTIVYRRDNDQTVDELLMKFKKVVQFHKIRRITRAQKVFLTKGQKRRLKEIVSAKKKRNYL